MSRHHEKHYANRIGWLRAAVLGANDGIVSTASLILGVAAAGSGQQEILLAAFAALTAGAMSMAAGEYVSVSSQADTERADLAREQRELEQYPESELRELAGIFRQRGLQPGLAMEVAEALTEHDALAAHAREELGLTETHSAKPVLAALASAATFSCGALLPTLLTLINSGPWQLFLVAGGSLSGLLALGALAAKAGGAPVLRGALRVGMWGALAMLATAAVGRLFGVAVG
ncbi:VIT family protein [Granulosicoccaceae sp. 1_MG-2023]|nr:VIT family protein [Granulosicoccaceae sp. 1_MG-2023]